jgi:hypothetical protein
MKKLLFIITTILVMSSCATTKDAKITRSNSRTEKKLAGQAVVKNAVESKKFIIKLDRIYFSHGGIVDLVPRNNFIIVDGRKAIISAAYFGRQYDIKPIVGINIRGESMGYELTDNQTNGKYDIKMTVSNGNTSFDVYLSIGKNGTCTASLTNLKIDYVRYSGHIVPIRENETLEAPEGIMI